ncbi:MAG: hypothetical protein AB1416_13155 [Actinomycetota bacterium]
MRRGALSTPAAAPTLGVLAGAGMVVAVFLPWYAANIGATFTAGTSSGWDATALARVVLGLGVVVALASLLLAADARGVLALDALVASALSVLLLAGSLVAAALVAYRMLVLPEPAEFLSRQIGLWAAVAACAAGAVAGIGQLSTRG